MDETQRLYDTLTLVVVVLLFNFLELRHPGYQVDRKRDLPLNILVILVVIVAGGDGEDSHFERAECSQGGQSIHLRRSPPAS